MEKRTTFRDHKQDSPVGVSAFPKEDPDIDQSKINLGSVFNHLKRFPG